VAYYAQIEPLYALLGVALPRVALRGHALVAENKTARQIDRLKLGAADIFSSADAILGARENAAAAEIRAIASTASRELASHLTRIGELALPAEHALARAVNRSIGHIEYHFEKLTERAIRSLARKDRQRWQAVHEVVATLYPDRHVQDRVVSWFPYWHRFGSHLVERVVDEIEPDSDTFCVVSL